MDNLTQQQRDAKQTNLDRQSKKMIAQFRASNKTERNAVIKQIDSFLPSISEQRLREFWLNFREKLKQVNQQ